jgi:transglutaminase-like putative cysteine protease
MWAALGGLLFGALVSRLRLNGWFAFFLSLLEGTAFTAFLLSLQVQPSDAIWNEKLLIIEDRFSSWVIKIIGGGVGTDAFIFVLIACAVAWLIGYAAAWSVFRSHQPWGAILPIGIGLLVNLFYAPPQSGLYLMLYLLAALLLLVRTTLLKRQSIWQQNTIRYANDIGLDFLTYGVVFSGLIILAAWLVPPTAPSPQWVSGITERVREPWQDLSDNVTRAFSTLRGTGNSGPTTYFGRNLLMGGPIHLGTRPVMDVRADAGRYWRATVFDKYNGSGWVSTATDSASFLAYDPSMVTPPTSQRRVVTQTVQVLLPDDNLIIAASQPLRVSESTDVRYLPIQATSDQRYLDIATIRSQQPLRVGDTYTVLSSLSGADEESLRAAPSSYPGYVLEHYVSLPSSVPARVHDLALQITQDAKNNYDKARAIEKYLREHIVYDDNVAPPPSGRDGVDYTLFDRPAGYCNYYASAMAVLAREVGIPARVASGYAVGQSKDGIYHVIEGNAHSWPELYFENLGWIEFEPTSSKAEIVRPVKQVASDQPNPNDLNDLNELRDLKNGRLNDVNSTDAALPQPGFQLPIFSGTGGMILAGVLVTLLLVVAFGGLVQFAWTRKLRTLPPGARALEEMYRFAPWVGLRERAHATPAERAQELSGLLPDSATPIHAVTAWYVRERYGAQSLSAEERASAAATSAQLRGRVLRGALDRYVTSAPQRVVSAMRELATRIAPRTGKHG